MSTLDCPKCRAPGAQRNAICERCGIVFEKYWKYHPRPGEKAPPRLSAATRQRPPMPEQGQLLLLKTRDPFGASVALWWLGENFLDIAPYINDARAGQLPLIGGNYGHSSPYGFHDWEYILTETGLLHLDHQLAQASHTLGALIMLLALGWGAVLLYQRFQVASGV